MAMMGYCQGGGLGKDEQGITRLSCKAATKGQGLGYCHFKDYYWPLSWGLHEHFIRGTTEGETRVSELGSLKEETKPLELGAKSLDDDEVYDLTWLFKSEAEPSSEPGLSMWRPVHP